MQFSKPVCYGIKQDSINKLKVWRCGLISCQHGMHNCKTRTSGQHVKCERMCRHDCELTVCKARSDSSNLAAMSSWAAFRVLSSVSKADLCLARSSTRALAFSSHIFTCGGTGLSEGQLLKNIWFCLYTPKRALLPYQAAQQQIQHGFHQQSSWFCANKTPLLGLNRLSSRHPDSLLGGINDQIKKQICFWHSCQSV